MGSRILDILFGPEPPPSVGAVSARCRYNHHVRCSGRAGDGSPGPGRLQCACSCHTPQPEVIQEPEPLVGWRALEHDRLAADPTIRRVSWVCNHAPNKELDKRYQHPMPGGTAYRGKGFAWRGQPLEAIPRPPFPHGPY